MCSALRKTSIKLRKKRFITNPFVCIYEPLVRFNYLPSIPFVCKNIPPIPNKLQIRQGLGFTLIELVVAMAIAAILVTVAIPNMRTFIQNGRLNTQANDLIGDLNLARSEAIKRRSGVGICKSTNGTACAGGGDWRDGRAVFVDINNNGAWDAGVDTILRFREPLASATDTLTTSVGLGDPIFFSANGASPNVPLGAVGTFTFCDDRGPTKNKQINLNSMGQAAVLTTPPAGC